MNSINFKETASLLAYEFTKPETWLKIGAGMVGLCSGQATALLGSSYTVILRRPTIVITGINASIRITGIIGLAMVIGSLAVGTLKCAGEAREELTAKNNDLFKIKKYVKPLLSGFFLGFIATGGILLSYIRKTNLAYEAILNQIRTDYGNDPGEPAFLDIYLSGYNRDNKDLDLSRRDFEFNIHDYIIMRPYISKDPRRW